jgi:hypothetical protein
LSFALYEADELTQGVVRLGTALECYQRAPQEG